MVRRVFPWLGIPSTVKVQAIAAAFEEAELELELMRQEGEAGEMAAD